jgi:serine protease Do
MTPELAQALGVPRRDGAVISAIDAGGPASKAGLRTGDVLDAINNQRPADSRAYMRAIVMLPTDSQAKLAIWRDGKEQTVNAAIAEWPNLMPQGGMMTGHMAVMMAQKAPDPGVKLALITDAARKQYGLDPKLTGVLISSVEADTEASDLGLAPGDVITSIQGAPVSTPDEVRNAIKTAHEQHRLYLAVLIQSKNAARWVSISIGAPTS